MNFLNFSSEDFLFDAKKQIKVLFKNQNNFAEKLYISRKSLNHILNSGDELTVKMVKKFCEYLNLSVENYMLKRI